ncbi:cardiolipin synthase [Paenibacillus beijingensis]|uniref:Cardiolipin synthase n=1 Tax=Paenibacillus beijingensis TaxID=1126833 RepID=A0A0D5NI59_9BACL|nr:cardiolipin synthase [Paenibacillus beijingensis]AJY74642.1 cardiolipin synthase [Paenibacillus beijingensis]
MLWITLALLLFIVQIASIIVVEYRRSNKAIAWVIIMFMFPLLGFLPYYFVAKEYSCYRTLQRKKNKQWEQFKNELIHRSKHRVTKHMRGDWPPEFNLHASLKNIPSLPITACNETTVYTEGKQAFEAMLESIAAAEHHIHIEFYIIRDDQLGTRFERLLIRKAQEGIQVRLLYDGIGSRLLGKAFLKRLRQAGVETGCFFPPLATFFDKRLNYRNHRKIVVVDGKTAYFGGLNIGDEYLGKDPELGYWRDTHFRLTGDAVLWVQYTFFTDWYLVKDQLITDSVYYPDQESYGKEWVQIVKSGPDETILELMFSLIVSAKKRIYIETPYFVPDPGILLALKTAVISGIDVRIIIPGVPDKKLVYNASLSYVQELLQLGVKFYCYQKGFIHAKVIISDNLACSGSANMDMRSFCGQFELNAVFFDGKVVDRLLQDFYRDLSVSNELTLPEFKKRSTIQKLKEVFARLLSPLF